MQHHNREPFGHDLYLLQHTPPGRLSQAQASLAALIEDQNERLATGQEPAPIPLAWIALAETAGLTVDLTTGRIIAGPLNAPVDLVTTRVLTERG